MTKSLFCPLFAMTNEAAEYVAQYSRNLNPVIDKYLAVGHCPLEVGSIINREFYVIMGMVIFSENKAAEGQAGLPKDILKFAEDQVYSEPKPIWTEEDATLLKTYTLLNDKGMQLSVDCRKAMIPVIDKILRDGFNPNEVKALLHHEADDYIFNKMYFHESKEEELNNAN